MNAKYRSVISALLCLSLFFVTNAKADILLGTVPVFWGGFGASLNESNVEPGFGITLMFTPGELSDCIGCSAYITPGIQNTIFNFTAANSPQWNNFIALLTDGNDRGLFGGVYQFLTDGSFNAGAAGGGMESNYFGHLLESPQFVNSIDLIQLHLHVTNFSVSGDTYNVSFYGNWRIFGIPGPDFKVPEPSSIALLAGGLLAIGIAASRRRRLSPSRGDDG